jgi:magnesium transporter
MLTAYEAREGKLVRSEAGAEKAVWIDLLSPTPDEETLVEKLLQLDVPTREDMQEIELSSRLYSEGGSYYLTAQVVAATGTRDPEIEPVTFVLVGNRLVTVRYHEPAPFNLFADWAAKQDLGCATGVGTLTALLETIVDRLADILEGEARKLDSLTKAIFEAHRPAGKAETLGAILQRIGRAEDLNGKVRESLSTIRRLLGFLSGQGAERLGARPDAARLKVLSEDVQSLLEAAGAQNQKIVFQLDATLGVINIRQSNIIKLFSVVAFVFLPPTLIASIYGMNFTFMPELAWPYGYPMALGLMFLSALVPYLIFRWKKWL